MLMRTNESGTQLLSAPSVTIVEDPNVSNKGYKVVHVTFYLKIALMICRFLEQKTISLFRMISSQTLMCILQDCQVVTWTAVTMEKGLHAHESAKQGAKASVQSVQS